ncbi:MAG: ImmA/IrrE family metallo-endopeptidase [Rhizobiales bacterium]|nr:ImmA/IrrE family metallo-endopeptidase [Hyphomicrobiales bacterium]
MPKFNHHMLTLARDSRGLTQAELSERMSVAQGTLSKYETGFSEPTEEFVSDLGGALGYPASFFFQDGRPYGFPPFHYRKRKKLSSKVLGRIVAEMNIRRMHILKLSLSFPLQSNAFIPEIDRDDYRGRGNARLNTEDVARQIREMWMLPSGPIDNMVDLIEEHGGIVVPCDFGTDLIDAMSQRIDGMPVLFFVNVNAPADRLRHTLAHELGHMVLHTITFADDDEMEQEADAFAGAFLVPADEIRTQLRRFDLRQLANLKTYWKVSMAALAVRADRLNLITPYQKKHFWIEMGKLGYRKREPNEPPKEKAKLLRHMVAFHIKKLGYSIQEMADMLHLNMRDFQQMYDPSATGPSSPERNAPLLRLVK